MNKIEHTFLKKILICIIIFASLIGIHNISTAVTVQTDVDVTKFFNTSSMMPERNISGVSGMFPQYYSPYRTVTLNDSRLNWATNSWKATMDGQVVYCADYGGYMRYGTYDVGNRHYLIPNGGTVIQGTTITVTGRSIESQINELFNSLRMVYASTAASKQYYTNSSGATSSSSNTFSATLTIKYPEGANGEEIAYLVGDESTDGLAYDRDTAVGLVETSSLEAMTNFLNQIDKAVHPGNYSSSIDSEYQNTYINAINGPEIVVMEQSSGGQSGYSSTGSSSYSNNAKAFIFSASEDAYGSSGYASEYTLNDIQGAYWLALVDEPEGEAAITPTTHLSENAEELYNKAKDYVEFSEDNTKYTINTNDAQVIADRDNKQYIVGPYSVTYPEYEDISYIKSIVINNNENLLYDETHSGIRIVLDGEGTTGSNGMEKQYPHSGQKFFIIFSAETAGYPTSVTLNVKFEYISKTEAEVEQNLTAQANIYKYYGYCEIDKGNYQTATGTVEMTFSWIEKKAPYEVPDGYHTDPLTGLPDYSNPKYKTVYENYSRTENEKFFEYTIYMPYIMMGDLEYTGDAQELVVIGDASREYKIIELEGGPITIDLTMELGGYVWVDEDGGKESISDGIYNNETKVPNVVVTLYREDGTQIGTTTTDSNGEYIFSELNAMYQYYVKFTYNGQFYQPTTYADSSTWGSSTWQTNSNAKDIVSERLSYNLKFESIGSSPENYTGSAGTNKTYTKQELLDAGIIDEFGNLIGSGNSSMVQYVKDCMMDAYTTADGASGLYPVPSIFLIADSYSWSNTPKLLLSGYDTEGNRVGISGISMLYPNAYYINLGLDQREESDLAVKKDVDHVTLEINGQTHTYTYDTLENKDNAENEWDISVRLSDAYYSTTYSRELYESDYIYKARMYGENYADYGKSAEDELEVYITYKIMVRNQATSIRARVDELVDYYDEDLEYIDERSYIEISQSRDNAAQKGIYSVMASSSSKYSSKTTTNIEGYDNLYITGLANLSTNSNNNYLAAGQTAYVYLTFKVKKDPDADGEAWVRLDEEVETAAAIGVGKENIVEVNGYSTQYAKGTEVPNVGDVSFTPAGIVDRDSNSGNLSASDVPKNGTINYGNFEDDTDKAPNIRIILYRDDDATRVISGSIWEDERTETIEATTTGDGIQDSAETLINGVTVQLVELMDNGTEYVWREFGAEATTLGEEIGGENTIGKGTGSGTVSSETPIINYKNLVSNYEFEDSHDGTYAFKSFMPGNFVVRFIYGDTERTVTPSSLEMGGLNEKSYNGQDYKSTTYQEGITQNKTYTWREASTWSLGQETLGNILTQVTTFKADASNNETANATVSAENQQGYLYDITASDAITNVSDAKDIESIRNAVNDYSDDYVTNYIAEVLASHKVDYDTMNDREQLLNDLKTNTKMTAETGMMVIELEYDTSETDGNKKDNSYKITNVNLGLEERAKAQLAIDKEVTNVKLTLADGSILFDAKATASNVLWRDHTAYSVGYSGNFMDESKFGSIQNIRTQNASKFGLIQLTMDEELMHGATIEITYQITVSNVGEVDYKDNAFYYTGNKSSSAQIVTTRADQVLDYVANNLQFNASSNSYWSVIEKETIQSDGLVNEELEDQVDKFNTIIVTESLNQDLVPTLYKDKIDSDAQDSVSVPLVLTQLITSENDTDDLTYRNLVEIVKTSNTVGRRMEYSVVGNQDPEESPQELDSDIAEVVRILPPFGDTLNYYIIGAIALGAIALAIGGIIFIKKKVLTK